jgi:hypothetical protein
MLLLAFLQHLIAEIRKGSNFHKSAKDALQSQHMMLKKSSYLYLP